MPDQITVSSDDRVLAVGRTGSGKTFLMRHLVRQLDRVIACDTKGISLTSWALAPWDRETRRLLANGDPVRARVAHDPAIEPLKFWDSVLREVFEAGNCVVYIDEIGLVTQSANAWPAYMFSCWTSGRERGVGGWAATQRPANIPIFLISEAEHVFCFRLRREEDRDRMGREIDRKLAAEIPRENEHGFFYQHVMADAPIYIPKLRSEHGEAWGEAHQVQLVDEERGA